MLRCAWAFTFVWCVGERHRESVLQNIAVNLESWTVQTKQETAIYHTLNKLSVDTSRKVGRKAYQHCTLAAAACWVSRCLMLPF